MKLSSALVLAGVTLALAACNRPDQNRTTSAPPGVSNPTAVTAPIVTPSAAPAPAERTAIPPNANAAAPGTNASVAFANVPADENAKLPPSKGGAPSAQEATVKAQEAAAKAPDTASGDEAKKETKASASPASGGATASDSAANNPRHGELTKDEESKQMPKAGQANNYSSPALEKDSGRPSTQ